MTGSPARVVLIVAGAVRTRAPRVVAERSPRVVARAASRWNRVLSGVAGGQRGGQHPLRRGGQVDVGLSGQRAGPGPDRGPGRVGGGELGRHRDQLGGGSGQGRPGDRDELVRLVAVGQGQQEPAGGDIGQVQHALAEARPGQAARHRTLGRHGRHGVHRRAETAAGRGGQRDHQSTVPSGRRPR